jgi:hypothetical protein
MFKSCKFPISALLAQSLTAPAIAQSGQMMPGGWQMTWPMITVCILFVVVLLLAAAALIKYLFFR